jgi:hypothetical protein
MSATKRNQDIKRSLKLKIASDISVMTKFVKGNC